MKVYLDNCCFNRPFDDQAYLKIQLETKAKLAIQQMILSGKLTLVWSFILEYENDQNPFELRRETISPWKELAAECVLDHAAVRSYAKDLTMQGIKTKDALHIACARSADCDFFITTDKKLLNKNVNDVKILSPIDFISEMEE